MGLYIKGLNRPRNEYMRIHIDFDGEVWVFRGSEWKSLGIKATDFDLVRCKECKFQDECILGSYGVSEQGFCYKGERRADEHNTKRD